MNERTLLQFDALPDSALADINTIAAYLGRGVSTVWRCAKSDPLFPKPIRLSARCTRWKVGEIRAYVAAKAGESDGCH
ncbi:helix-turn-helix transcriptional regulator [Nitrosococcus wardiae]|uniref:AlpA family phage regulatory protein n=1 Tax=Nitrosococcus wardiae TaxID=1814290 RepID=A0A4P7BWK5_9GAMM|nr:AlpA family phage regulatory protein [Nitrosococcus wardiae]QBQ54331.1 AlpA family phage regulatory protein [Nitrosococcus wardiae]